MINKYNGSDSSSIVLTDIPSQIKYFKTARQRYKEKTKRVNSKDEGDLDTIARTHK